MEVLQIIKGVDFRGTYTIDCALPYKIEATNGIDWLLTTFFLKNFIGNVEDFVNRGIEGQSPVSVSICNCNFFINNNGN